MSQPETEDSFKSTLPAALQEDLKHIFGQEAVHSAHLPDRYDKVPEDEGEEGENPLIKALEGDAFPLKAAQDSRMEKIARHNMARMMDNLTVKVTSFEAKVYDLTQEKDLVRYNANMLASLGDKTIVVTEEPIQYLVNEKTGVLRVVVVVKTMKMVPEVKGVDRMPLDNVTSSSKPGIAGQDQQT